MYYCKCLSVYKAQNVSAREMFYLTFFSLKAIQTVTAFYMAKLFCTAKVMNSKLLNLKFKFLFMQKNVSVDGLIGWL